MDNTVNTRKERELSRLRDGLSKNDVPVESKRRRRDDC